MIPNGVNKPNIRTADEISTQYGLVKNDYILYLGRLVPEKGLEYLVKAFKFVKTEKKLVIAGGSSDTEEFEQKIRNIAKEDTRILFTGFVQGKILKKEI